MRTLKLLNKKIFSIIIIYFSLSILVSADDKPIDIWNLEKKENETTVDTNVIKDDFNNNSKDSIYNMQTNKIIEPIKFDQDLNSKEIRIEKFILFNNFEIFIWNNFFYFFLR